ncbi:hypothetical protein BAUCODRAFT_294980 [Baudoinia panamericana UAMH 10762]|uniref:Phytanoyl-CoA dioxygenase family protein n=1 Tax=Baudoinia panamericana (strain UAMH 10762) TaxID=717646 RepID=M2M862_BAUPA|nr:uncharacterized protein BAUCODRAFT_294980 [Baudoinia panamericana UAMH 10762]EMC92531.1 hypothetical protein BAUCODRAFT_294980 [Baudoinia panamericana UAMH 10762]
MTRSVNGRGNSLLHNQEVHSAFISDEARESGTVSPELIAEAVTYLHRDGILVLENAIKADHLSELEALLGPEAEQIARDPDHHFNFGKETRNMDQAPPLIPELMFMDVWANPIAVGILTAIFGPSPVCHYANGNTALKAKGRQPVHSDIEKPHPLYPFAYAINIPLCDTSAENGSTEVWVGSHRDSCVDQHTKYGAGEYGLTIRSELLSARRQRSPPIQPSTKKGSLIIRDIRLWHAGMPNKTDVPRIMLAFVVQPKWFQAPSKVLLPLKAKPLVERWRTETGLEYAAQWVDGDVDHRKVNSDEVDFSTGNVRLLGMEELMHQPAE